NAVQRLLREDQNHLSPILAALRKKPELGKYVERILNGEKVRFAPGLGDRRQAQLELIGVIKADTEGYCTIRNPIYVQALTRDAEPENPTGIEQRLTKSIRVFLSYAHADERLCKTLIKHLADLKRQGLITHWYDRDISAGTGWTQEIESHLNMAQLILLLVSPDFLSSDYCYDVEMKRAMERHECGEALVVPIILRPVSWKGAPFAKLQALPRNAKAVTSWLNRDGAFLDITEGILDMIARL
ncbi:MAG: TIR domain-containing protein, partial [Ktedonobacteraceae bacterium]